MTEPVPTFDDDEAMRAWELEQLTREIIHANTHEAYIEDAQAPRKDLSHRFYWSAVSQVLVVIGIVVYAFARQGSTTHDPLSFHGEYVSPNVYHNGQDVHTGGIRCNSTHKAITVSSILIWTVDSPSGEAYTTQTAVRTYSPGCSTGEGLHPMPLAIQALNTQLLQSHPYVLWHISGVVTPLIPGGVTRSWSTPTFRVVK
jgi:hypothetical protein